jgi:modification methylase
MSSVPDESAHLVITSPPYWQLKDYGQENQIGYNDSYENYINNLNLVWQEAHRILYPGTRLCINIGDQFARSVYYGRYKVIPIRTEIIRFCETLGMDYMGAIIWQKVTTTNTTGGASVMGSFPYPRNGILKLDYEFILIFKKPGIAPTPTKEQKEHSKMTTEEWNKFFVGHWTFPGVKQEKHLAMFPEELPARLIRMFSFVGETILDPFWGSGTTSLAAKNLNRNSIGYEINPDFIDFGKKKLGIAQTDIEGTEFFFKNDPSFQPSDSHFSKLPYHFKDPLKLDKKIDPKSLQYGSKIDENSGERQDFYRVKEVLQPNLLKLENNLIVRLIGIIEKPGLRNAAMSFLEEKVKGEKVFLRFDEKKYDDEMHPMAYIYLKNKTFINAHLIKNKLVLADRQSRFLWKEKFIRLENANG